MLGKKRERAYVWTRARKGFSSSCYSIDNLLCGGHEGKNVLLIIDFRLLQKGLLLCIGLEYCSANIQPPPPLPSNEVYFPIFGLAIWHAVATRKSMGVIEIAALNMLE